MSKEKKIPAAPPDNLPTYRLLTGLDDAEFCRRVSEAIALGYKLYGSPAATFNGQKVIVAQAIIWPTIEAEIEGVKQKCLALEDSESG
jgi:hypothetical protein